MLIAFCPNSFSNNLPLKECKDINIESPYYMSCFTVELSVGFLSVSAEICCWRWTPRSPKFKCDFASNLRQNGEIWATDGYIDIESLSSELKDKIEKNKLTKLNISSETIFIENNKSYTVKEGEYDIIKDNDGMYLKVEIIVASL